MGFMSGGIANAASSLPGIAKQAARRTAAPLVLMTFALAGCEPPPLAENGVVGVFGAPGLGPGDFTYPRALAINKAGRVCVVDKSGRIQWFSPDGTYLSGWKMPETTAGKPVGITCAADGRLFVADTHYNRVMVFDEDGRELARFGEKGEGDGQFLLPTDVAIDAKGFIYVGEYGGNDRVTKWSPEYKFVKTLVRGEIAGAILNRPAGLDIDEEQTLWVADACNHRVLRFDLDGRLLSSWGTMGREPGQMRYPYDLACTPDGELLLAEFGNDRIQWFDKEGHSVRVWGSQGRRLGEIWAPWGAAVGPNGLVYVVDSLNARVQMVKL